MSASKFIDPEDLMLYALQSLSAGEAAEMEEHLEQNAGSRRELAEVRGDLALVGFTAEMTAPRAQARARFLKQVAEEPRGAGSRAARPLRSSNDEAGSGDGGGGTIPIDTYRARQEAVPVRRGVAARILPWAGWAVAAGLAFTAGQLYREREGLRETVAGNQNQLARTTAEAATAREVLSAMNDQTAQRVTLTRTGTAATPTGRTVYSAEKGVLIFTASDLAPVDTFKVYELWIIPANGGAPIPVGTFHPDAKGFANLVSTEMPKGVEAKAFGITVEDDGGAKTPTLPIVMTGA